MFYRQEGNTAAEKLHIAGWRKGGRHSNWEHGYEYS